jgi:hypothetical protein
MLLILDPQKAVSDAEKVDTTRQQKAQQRK